MASLKNTSINGALTASTSVSAPALITNQYSYKEYCGTVAIPSAVNNPINYVNLFGNLGVHERMMGDLYWWVTQSQYHGGALRFQLSEYGLNTYTTLTTGGWTVERYNPVYGTNYLRFNNTINTVWGDGMYYFNVRFYGMSGSAFTSSYLTTRVR